MVFAAFLKNRYNVFSAETEPKQRRLPQRQELVADAAPATQASHLQIAAPWQFGLSRARWQHVFAGGVSAI